MNDELHSYIRKAHHSGDDHQTIRDRLIGAGWHPTTVNDALDKHSPKDLGAAPVEAALGEPNFSAAGATQPQDPIGVVKVFSTRGVEYYFMLIALAVSATALGTLLISIAEEILGDSRSTFDPSVMAFTASALIVSFPIFAFLFLRLKKAELLNPRLRLDQSRRRMVQIALIVSFVVGLFSTIGYLFTLLAAAFGGSDYEVANVGLMIADLIITLGIVGGIFTYFWLDSHRKGEL